GELFAAGQAGERFAVRNSGAVAVVEGVGNHGCEYMTGGTVVILGEVGFNFGAGMSGGIAFVYDPHHRLPIKLNPNMVSVEPLSAADERYLQTLIRRHTDKTGSARGGWLLEHWHTERTRFKKIVPDEMVHRTAAQLIATAQTR
ncbi:MAG TPA: hypothetical protein ENJ48_00715, partial [Anaerolineae bacterium]|nr:hypothetical protein [Anaerolineae bacterium]